ncbi:MAG: pilus assembly protein N-terminal domain-containing protein [Alphaproteobacteria bacterium]
MFAAPAASAPLTSASTWRRHLRLDRPAASVVVGNPSIADIQIETSTLMFLRGRATTARPTSSPSTATARSSFRRDKPASAKRRDMALERGIGGRLAPADAPDAANRP